MEAVPAEDEPPAVEGLGRASKVICALNETLPPSQLPPLPPAPLEPDLVALCSDTSLTPSIRRRRLSISATSAWLTAQPVSANVGTLPGGVAEVTEEPLAEEPAAALELEALVEEPEPTVPLRDARETLPGGSTRPSS